LYTTEETVVKKSNIGRNLLFLALLTGTAYSGATYLALTDEAFHDTFTTYVPGGEKLLDALEDWAEDENIKKYYQQSVDLKDKASTHAGALRQFASNTKETAQDFYEYVHDAIAQLTGEKEAPAVPGQAPSPTAARRIRKKALFTNVIHTNEAQPVPKFESFDDAALNELAATVQDLVKMLNEADMSGHAKRLVDVASKDIDTLNKTLSLIHDEQKKAVAEIVSLQASVAALQAKSDTHKAEVDDKIKAAQHTAESRADAHAKHVESDIGAATAALVKEYEAAQADELAKQRSTHLKQLVEELKAKAVEIQTGYIEQVKRQVEEERGGRLSQIEVVSERQTEVEKLAQADAELLDDVRKAHQLLVAIDALKKAATAGEQTQFEVELQALRRLSAKTPFAKLGERQSDELIQLVSSSIQDQIAKYGITSLAQLSERFDTVAREVRRAALIPDEDASMVSHFISIVLSSVMFTKKGLVAGDDIESRLARAEYYLNTEKDLESAAREMNQLTGWPKRLSLDWLEAARRHLEVKQSLEVSRYKMSFLVSCI
jgi:mitofilin